MSVLTAKQKKFMIDSNRRKNRITLLYGSVRSGKTFVSLLWFTAFVLTRPKEDEFLMIGKTMTTLKRNSLNLLQKLVGEENFSYAATNKEGRLFGRTVWLEGADNEAAESKIKGMTLAGVYMDEATEIPKAVTMQCFARISLPGARFIGTTNPDDPENYVNQEIILNPVIDKHIVKFELDDNTFLDPAYKENLKKEFTGVFYERFILGNFVRAEGVIFRQFADDPEKWILDKVPEDVKWMTFGIDFGVNKSKTIFICTGIREHGAGVVILDEFRISESGVKPDEIERRFCEFVRQCIRKYPNIKPTYCWTDQPETLTLGIAATVRREGLPVIVVIANKRQINDRIYAKERMLNLGKWQVMRHCVMVIYSTSNQLWNEKKTEKGQDVRLDNDPKVNDVADAEEYSWEEFIEEMEVAG